MPFGMPLSRAHCAHTHPGLPPMRIHVQMAHIPCHYPALASVPLLQPLHPHSFALWTLVPPAERTPRPVMTIVTPDVTLQLATMAPLSSCHVLAPI